MDWSPDGRHLVYATRWTRNLDTGYLAGGNLHVVSRDGRRTRELVHRKDRAETEPVWSPDGRWIAWVGIRIARTDVSPPVEATLHRVAARGGAPRRIRRLPKIRVDDSWYAPELTWLPAARERDTGGDERAQRAGRRA